jgi:RsiW-degrading membrane proteinase PrsW (M82 family)
MHSLNAWQLLGLLTISAMWWLNYVQSKDRHQPEPLGRLLVAFALGIVACLLALLAYSAVERCGVPDVQYYATPWTAVYCFGIIGPIEEGAKLLVALFVFRWRDYDEPLDGFVYSSAVALGFASAENFNTGAGDGWVYQLAYAAVLPITHVLFSSIWGFGFGYARFCVSRPSHRALWKIGSVALSMFAHGLYDFLLFAFQATLATSAIALVIWVFVNWRVRVLRSAAVAARTGRPFSDRCPE